MVACPSLNSPDASGAGDPTNENKTFSIRRNKIGYGLRAARRLDASGGHKIIGGR